MSGIILGVLCNVGYYLFIFILHITSGKSFEVIEAIPILIFIRYTVRIVLAYFILSLIYNKIGNRKNKLENTAIKE